MQALLERTRSPREIVLGAMMVSDVIGDISIEAAMEWREQQWSSVESYANIRRTTDGGTHVAGLLNGLAAGLRDATPHRCAKRPIRGLREAIRHGLHAVICVRLHDPTYDRPTLGRLTTPEAEAAVSTAMRRAFARHLRESPALLEHTLRLIDGPPAAGTSGAA